MAFVPEPKLAQEILQAIGIRAAPLVIAKPAPSLPRGQGHRPGRRASSCRATMAESPRSIPTDQPAPGLLRGPPRHEWCRLCVKNAQGRGSPEAPRPGERRPARLAGGRLGWR